MKLYRSLAATIALSIAVGSAFGQAPVIDNPFPDVIGRSRVIGPFDDQAPKVMLTGVITQQPTHILPSNPYQYFRMGVSNPDGTAIWAVLLRASDEETSNLKPGVTVTVLATPSKDGSRRVELVQSEGPNRSGLMNLSVNYQTLETAGSLYSLFIKANGRAEISDNPFPDVIARARVIGPFDDRAPKVTLTGVITQQLTHILPSNPYQYFRMGVSNPDGTAIWAVLLRASDEEISNLKPGVTVTVLATPGKDGSRRVELVQSAGPNRTGLMNLTVAQ